jgi:transposase
MSSVKYDGPVWLGLDVHKESITAGVLREHESTPRVEVIGPEPEAVRRLVRRLSVRPGQVRSCYEAGPSGYGLHRLLTGLGARCEVIAPSLIPKAAGDRVKTDQLTELPRPMCGWCVRGGGRVATVPARDHRGRCAA